MLERALVAHPRPDHRHTLQHCQMPDPALFRRIKALGICCNLFANHIYYWGEEHIAQHDGPVAGGPHGRLRHARCAWASPSPSTPTRPSRRWRRCSRAWCAVMRLTATGRVLGEGERIPVAHALARDHAGRGLHAEAGRR